MTIRLAVVAAVLGLVAFAVWHPAARPVPVPLPAASAAQAFGAFPDRPRRHGGRFEQGGELVVYVAGAVRRPGLYHLRGGDRGAQAVAAAGGLSDTADAAGVNLAQRAADGDEIYVPQLGEARRSYGGTRRSYAGAHRSRRRSATPPPEESVDVNAAGAAELATVPGIGRAIAQRIVELRAREGSFASLDELLDVAGMTASRLERARPYLRGP